MSEQHEMSDDVRREFNNMLMQPWDDALDRFFDSVETYMGMYGLTVEQVEAALNHGYGDTVADYWVQWIEDQQ